MSKHPGAVALGRLGGRKASDLLTDEQRLELEKQKAAMGVVQSVTDAVTSLPQAAEIEIERE